MKNWERKTFGEVLDVLRNGVNCKQDKKGIGEKISRIESISSGEFDVDRVGYTHLKEEEKVKYKLEYGDILFSHINSPIHVGKTAIFKSDDEIYHGVNLLLMRPKSFLDKTYFEHYLKYLYQNGYWKGLCKQSVNQASVNQQDINKVEITFPKSLYEQQRIVSILDEAFAAIAKAKANAEQNLKNAKELFECYLQGVFGGSTGSPTKRDGWEIKTLGEVSKINYGYTEKASFDEVGPKFLRITDIQENGVDWETVPYCKCSDKDLPKYKLETGDIVFARTGATTGKSYLINNPPNSVFASYLIRLRMNSINEFIPEFISYFFQTKTYWDKINAGISGSAQGGFNATKLGELEFHFPKSKEEQQTIVRQLDALRAETQKLEAVYQKKIDDLEELKKSILQKAFAGELTSAGSITEKNVVAV